MKRVAVTGVGAVSPLGLDAPSTWRAAIAGESGIDWIQAFDASEYPVRVAGEVKGFDPTHVASAKEARKLERNVLFAMSAAREALDDSGLNGFDPNRVGIVFGSTIGGIPGIVEQVNTLRDRGYDRVSPSFLPNVLVDTASGQLAISLGIKGPNRGRPGLRNRIPALAKERDDPSRAMPTPSSPRRCMRDPTDLAGFIATCAAAGTRYRLTPHGYRRLRWLRNR